MPPEPSRRPGAGPGAGAPPAFRPRAPRSPAHPAQEWSQPVDRVRAGGQPGRDRLAGDPGRPSAGGSRDRRLLGGGPGGAPCPSRRRGLPDRPGAGRRELPCDRQAPGRGRSVRRFRAPSRLRLPGGAGRLRRSGGAGGNDLRGPVSRSDSRHGRQDGGSSAHDGRRRARRARNGLAAGVGPRCGRSGPRDRLPRCAQGGRRRRRKGDEGRPGGEGAPAGLRGRRPRGAGGVRRRPRVRRALFGAPAPRGDAGVRRPPRQRGPPVRTGVLGPAQAPEAAGRGPVAPPGTRGARANGQGGGARGPSGGVRRGRNRRVPPSRRRVLLPGDEHAPSGRAPRHRDDHGPGLGGVADSGRVGRAASPSPATGSPAGTRDRVPDHQRVPVRRLPAFHRRGAGADRARRPRRPLGRGSRRGRRGRPPLRPVAGQAGGPRTGPGRRRPADEGRAGRAAGRGRVH